MQCFLQLLMAIAGSTLFAQALYNPGNILLMDHLNINHQKITGLKTGHELVKCFYVDMLGLSLDPRKIENIEKGRKTLWTNAGINQFHLPEAETAQVFDGVITLAFKDKISLEKVVANLQNPLLTSPLDNTKFHWSSGSSEEALVHDPWGSTFRLVVDPAAEDVRGKQPGSPSSPCAMSDLCVHVPQGTNLAGIARFYDQIMQAPCVSFPTANDHHVSIITSPQQTLTFKHSPSSTTTLTAQESDMERDNTGKIIANTGPHISMYIKDLPGTYQRAEALGVVIVNTRFKRQAFSLDDAVDQCMFRTIEVVDPLNKAGGVLVHLEHEIRSVINRDGTKYKSAPFDTIPR